MPRKRNEQKERHENYNKAFPTVMRTLMQTTTQAELAKYLSKTRQSITYYCDGSSSPDWETLVKIADYFNVSTDYLLGRTKEPCRQPCATDDLGLTAEAIAYIRQYVNPVSNEMEEVVKPKDCLDGLSMLIENGSFVGIAGMIKRFCDAVNKNIEISNAYQSGNPPTARDDYFKFRRAYEENLLTTQMKKMIVTQYPTLQGTFEVLIGQHVVDFQKRIIVDAFEEELRRLSNYNEFKNLTIDW